MTPNVHRTARLRFANAHSAVSPKGRGPNPGNILHSSEGNIMNFTRRLLCLLVAIACLLAGAMAQVQTAELHVIVKDAKGAVVSGATVTAAEPGKGVSRTASTNAEGVAILLSLPPGLYTVTVEAPGFAKMVNESVRLTIGQVAELPVAVIGGRGYRDGHCLLRSRAG